jgi:hypothetical protein
MAQKYQAKLVAPDAEQKKAEAGRQTEATKTTRLRALRLAKEAADREAATQKAAPSVQPRRRVREPQAHC